MHTQKKNKNPFLTKKTKKNEMSMSRILTATIQPLPHLYPSNTPTYNMATNSLYSTQNPNTLITHNIVNLKYFKDTCDKMITQSKEITPQINKISGTICNAQKQQILNYIDNTKEFLQLIQALLPMIQNTPTTTPINSTLTQTQTPPPTHSNK